MDAVEKIEQVLTNFRIQPSKRAGSELCQHHAEVGRAGGTRVERNSGGEGGRHLSGKTSLVLSIGKYYFS